ncbi:MAG: TIGR01777 family oxidoreductase [Bacteroidota bacterium]
MATVLIGGGSGLMGSRLSQLLQERGHEVRHFSRSAKPGSEYPTYTWNVQAGTYDETALEGVTHVINLAGAGIADAPWTAKRKKLIISSRTDSTHLLQEGILKNGKSVKAFLAGSAIGYYGNRGENIMTEDSAPGDNGFLAESVKIWETATQELTAATKLPTLTVRTGIVLSTKGGALPKMMLPLNVLTSTYFGRGQQWYSWVHIDDICQVFVRGVEDDTFRGVYNGVAPNPARNKTLAGALIEASGKAAVLVPAPAFALKLTLGEMSHTVLDSARVSAAKLEQAGFTFQFPDLVEALRDLLNRKV